MYYIKAQLKSTPQLGSWNLPFPPSNFVHIKQQFHCSLQLAYIKERKEGQGEGPSHLHTSRSRIHLLLLSPKLQWVTSTAIFKSGGSKRILEQQWWSKMIMIFGKTISPLSNVIVSHHFQCSRLITRASEKNKP